MIPWWGYMIIGFVVAFVVIRIQKSNKKKSAR
jgi:hypothetical protein